MRLLTLVLFLLPVVACFGDRSDLALREGEMLTYRVAWAVVRGAGEIKIAAEKEAQAQTPQIRVITTTVTRGLARMLLPFEARSESLFDVHSGRLLWLHETSHTRGKRSNHSVTFDYATGQAIYAKAESEQKPRELAMPAGEPTDLITALLQTRSWNLQPGESRDALVLFDDDFYELTIHAEQYEEVKTPLGSFKALLLVPRMEKAPPKGMFKRGSSVRVWIAQDTLHLPVRFEVEFKIGTGVATLISYRRGSEEK